MHDCPDFKCQFDQTGKSPKLVFIFSSCAKNKLKSLSVISILITKSKYSKKTSNDGYAAFSFFDLLLIGTKPGAIPQNFWMYRSNQSASKRHSQTWSDSAKLRMYRGSQSASKRPQSLTASFDKLYEASSSPRLYYLRNFSY